MGGGARRWCFWVTLNTFNRLLVGERKQVETNSEKNAVSFLVEIASNCRKIRKKRPVIHYPSFGEKRKQEGKRWKEDRTRQKKQTPLKTCVKNLAIIFLVFVSQKGRFFSQGGTLKITIFSAKKGGKKMLFLKPVKKQNHFVSVLIFLA